MKTGKYLTLCHSVKATCFLFFFYIALYILKKYFVSKKKHKNNSTEERNKLLFDVAYVARICQVPHRGPHLKHAYVSGIQTRIFAKKPNRCRSKKAIFPDFT
jgi:hypothetical protein